MPKIYSYKWNRMFELKVDPCKNEKYHMLRKRQCPPYQLAREEIAIQVEALLS